MVNERVILGCSTKSEFCLVANTPVDSWAIVLKQVAGQQHNCRKSTPHKKRLLNPNSGATLPRYGGRERDRERERPPRTSSCLVVVWHHPYHTMPFYLLTSSALLFVPWPGGKRVQNAKHQPRKIWISAINTICVRPHQLHITLGS